MLNSLGSLKQVRQVSGKFRAKAEGLFDSIGELCGVRSCKGDDPNAGIAPKLLRNSYCHG
jgi:hypothetical protein